MALEREKFIVVLQDPNENLSEHSITIHHQDMLRGELEHNRQGNPDNARLNLVTCWCWAALTRMGVYTGPYERFRDFDLVGMEDDGKETVPPTVPGTPED